MTSETINHTNADASSARRWLRSIGAILAGLLTVIVLSTVTDIAMHATGIFPPWFQPMSTPLWLLATAYRIVYGVAGGYVTARLAPDRPVNHALVLGLIGFVLSLIGAAATWDKGPEFGPQWYPLGLVAFAIPCSWAGAKLARRPI